MGGEPAQPAQIIPAPSAPSVSQTAAESAQAQLQYNPQLVAQQVALQQQYGTPLAQSQFNTQAAIAPQYRDLLMQQYPELRMLQNSVQQGFGNQGYDNAQLQALNAIRDRETQRGLTGIREGANLGGTLFGGRRQQAEEDFLTRQAQGYSAQDIGFQQQQQAQNLQRLVTLLQLSNPQVQQPAVPSFGQSVAPGGDALYSALVNNQGNFGVIPGTPAGPSLLQSFMGGFR